MNIFNNTRSSFFNSLFKVQSNFSEMGKAIISQENQPPTVNKKIVTAKRTPPGQRRFTPAKQIMQGPPSTRRGRGRRRNLVQTDVSAPEPIIPTQDPTGLPSVNVEKVKPKFIGT